MKTVNETVSDIIEGTINCWQIEAKEECDLRWQLRLMVSRCFEELARDITEEIKNETNK